MVWSVLSKKSFDTNGGGGGVLMVWDSVEGVVLTLYPGFFSVDGYIMSNTVLLVL